MTWGFAAQRRADRFDAMVEGDSAVDARDAELLELVGAMRAVPPVQARPEFTADLRERLMAEAATALVPADVSRLKLPDRRPTRERRLAAVVGGIVVVGATTSVAVASQSALPGDSLYPVKRAIERVHTGLSVGEGSQGNTVLASASTRLDEVDEMTRRGDTGAVEEARIARALDTFTEQAIEASDLLVSDYENSGNAASIERLRDFAASSLDQLTALEPYIPAEARDELIRAAGVLSTIDAEAAQRCPTCGGPGITTFPAVLMASTPMTVPVQPEPRPTENADGNAKPDKGKGGKGQDLPDVDPDDVGPGSISEPTTPALPGTTAGSNPLQDLVDGLTGGGTGGGTNASGDPSIPVVSDLLNGVGEILEGVIDPLTGRVEKN